MTLKARVEAHLAKEDDLLLPLLASAPGVSLADLVAGVHELLEQADDDAGGCSGHSCACGEADPPGHPELDARTIPHAIRHATIFGALESIQPGAGLVLVAPHDPLPLLTQNCGFYSSSVQDEYAVHSLEHGAVWITYAADLPENQVELLQRLAHSGTHVLVSPYADLPSAVVASAWGLQLRLESAADQRLEQFVAKYAQGPQTPEPGAPCSGGAGNPA